MYKFLVIDDEEIVRRGFRNKIDWAAAGYEFLPPCKNGREAIARIPVDRPDVVMTDICMPFVDGLEVASFIAKEYPEIAVIILSGYGEFEYARAALRCKVVEYLLKPITSSELLAVISKVKNRLDEKTKNQNQWKDAGKERLSHTELNNQPLPVSINTRNMGKVKLAEFQNYIQNNFAQKKLNLQDISRDLYISPSYLARILKQYTGKSFVDALTEYRIEMAKKMLADPEIKTCVVAEKVGFSDPHYFSTIFKKSTGKTPTEYRCMIGNWSNSEDTQSSA